MSLSNNESVTDLDSMSTKIDVYIRWMIHSDMPDVLAIEISSFEFPWTKDDFERTLRQRNCAGMVAEIGELVVGFMIFEFHRKKIHVLDFAVHPNLGRQRIGRQMVDELVGKLSMLRRNRIVIHLRETDLQAQFFFRSCGFVAVEVIREHFSDTREDAYKMVRTV